MAVTVEPIKLWRREIENRPGALAEILKSMANADADLQVVMCYRFPGNKSKGAIELYPVTDEKATAAAQAAGLSDSGIAALLVEGDNTSGIGYALVRSLTNAGINLDFLVAQVIGERYSAIFGFETEADANKAAPLLKRAAAGRKK